VSTSATRRRPTKIAETYYRLLGVVSGYPSQRNRATLRIVLAVLEVLMAVVQSI